jgi:hypothetical protein
MDFADNLRALVLAQLALANRDPKKLAAIIARLTEMLGAALVVAFRDDQRKLDEVCAGLEASIHRSAVEQLEVLKAIGALDGDDPPVPLRE